MANKDQNIHIEFHKKLAPVAGGMTALATLSIVYGPIDFISAFVTSVFIGIAAWGLAYISQGFAALLIIVSTIIVLGVFLGGGDV